MRYSDGICVSLMLHTTVSGVSSSVLRLVIVEMDGALLPKPTVTMKEALAVWRAVADGEQDGREAKAAGLVV